MNLLNIQIITFLISEASHIECVNLFSCLPRKKKQEEKGMVVHEPYFLPKPKGEVAQNSYYVSWKNNINPIERPQCTTSTFKPDTKNNMSNSKQESNSSNLQNSTNNSNCGKTVKKHTTYNTKNTSLLISQKDFDDIRKYLKISGSESLKRFNSNGKNIIEEYNDKIQKIIIEIENLKRECLEKIEADYNNNYREEENN